MIITTILILIIIFSPLARGSVSPLAFGILHILTAFALLSWFLQMFREGVIRLKRTQLDIPIFIFSVLAIISIFRSPYLHDSIVELFKLLNLFAIFYLVINHIKERHEISRIVNLIVILGAALSLFGIIQYLGGITNSWWSNKGFLSSVYVNHNHFAGFLELCIPLGVGLVLGARSTEKKSFYIYLVILMLVAFMFSMSRGGWLSLSCAMMIMFILLYKKGFAGRGFFVALVVLLSVGFLIVKNMNIELFLSRIASYKELDFSGRLEIWKGTLRIIQDRPLFGTGLGTFIYYFPRYRPVGFNLFANYAHNDYLQVMSEMGMFALLCMIYILFLIVKKGFNTYLISQSNFKRCISIGAAIGVLSIAIHSLGDFNLRIPANAILLTVLSGIIFNLRSRGEGPDSYLEIKLNKASLYLFRPVFTVATFVWILCISRLVMAEVIYKGVNSSNLNDRIKILKKAIYLLPENNSYYKDLGQIYINRASNRLDKEKDLLRALAYYQRASEINPMDGWAHLGRGDAFLYLGYFKEAKDAYQQAVDLDPTNSYYLKKIGNAMVREGNTVASVKAFKHASFIEKNRISLVSLDYDAARPEPYIERGDLYYKESKLKDALNMYKIAEALDPEKEDIKMKIASLLERMGQRKNAGEYISSIPLNASREVIFLNSRARYLISRGKYKEADTLIEEAFSINGDDYITLQNKIDLLQKQRRPYREVRPYMHRILELNGNSAEGLISGKNIILTFDLEEDGIMARSGTKEISFILPLGLIDVKIFASGTFAKDEWPHMLVSMNSRPILSTYVSSSSYAEFNASGFSTEGIGLIQIEFSNDYWDSLTGEDRNLKIKKVILEYKYPDYES